MSKYNRRDNALGKTEETGKEGSFCQGFVKEDCDKAKSACQWINGKLSYCERRINTDANLAALSKFNTNKKSKLSTEITIAFSMYHKNGDKMTTEENDDLIEGDTFVKWVAYSILQDFVGEGELFEPEEVKHGSSTVDNFILVTIPFSGHQTADFWMLMMLYNTFKNR